MNLNPFVSGAIGVALAFPVVALLFGEINEQNGWLIVFAALLISMVLSHDPNAYGSDEEE